MNPDGQTARLQGGYTYGVFAVTASPSVVAPGAAMTVNFSAPSGRGCSGGGDWIAIYLGPRGLEGAEIAEKNRTQGAQRSRDPQRKLPTPWLARRAV
jgi:hypothetical protein